MFIETTTTADIDQQKLEKDFKKLLTVTKSKFYMLRVNFPQAFDNVNFEVTDNSNFDENEHDPFAARTPNTQIDN